MYRRGEEAQGSSCDTDFYKRYFFTHNTLLLVCRFDRDFRGTFGCFEHKVAIRNSGTVNPLDRCVGSRMNWGCDIDKGICSNQWLIAGIDPDVYLFILVSECDIVAFYPIDIDNTEVLAVFEFAIGNPLATSGKVAVTATADGNLLATAETTFIMLPENHAQRRWNDWDGQLWGNPAGAYEREYMIPLKTKVFRDYGIDTVITSSRSINLR